MASTTVITIFIVLFILLAVLGVALAWVLTHFRRLVRKEKQNAVLEIHMAYSDGYAKGGKELLEKALAGMDQGTVQVPERAARRIYDEGWSKAEKRFKERLEMLTESGKIIWKG